MHCWINSHWNFLDWFLIRKKKWKFWLNPRASSLCTKLAEVTGFKCSNVGQLAKVIIWRQEKAFLCWFSEVGAASKIVCSLWYRGTVQSWRLQISNFSWMFYFIKYKLHLWFWLGLAVPTCGTVLSAICGSVTRSQYPVPHVPTSGGDFPPLSWVGQSYVLVNSRLKPFIHFWFGNNPLTGGINELIRFPPDSSLDS